MGRKKKFETYEERYYLSWGLGNNSSEIKAHIIEWIFRTAIFHYSNGTNKCCIDGCDASIEALTLEHENFDRVELNRSLGYADNTGGNVLARALLYSGFPDVNITVKCFKHNMMNKHPKNGISTNGHYMTKNRDHIPIDYEKQCSLCKNIKNQKEFGLRTKAKDGLQNYCNQCNNDNRKQNHKLILIMAYKLYGYEGPIEGMSWEHSNNDGYLHRKYLAEKYNQHSNISGVNLAALLLKEHEQGIPNYPGLIVVDMNEQMIGLRKYRKEKRESLTSSDISDTIQS